MIFNIKSGHMLLKCVSDLQGALAGGSQRQRQVHESLKGS